MRPWGAVPSLSVWCWSLAALLQLQAPLCDGLRALALFHYHGYSHWAMFRPLLLELARRGHHVTVLSHFPQDDAPPTYEDRSLKGAVPSIVNTFSVDFAMSSSMIKFIWFEMQSFCRPNFEHPVTKELIKNKEKFDVILLEVFGPDCFAAFHHHLGGVPVVGMTSSVMLPWGNSRVGNPDNPAYIPNYFMPFSSRMNFWERLVNTVSTFATSVGFDLLVPGPVDELNREYFGNEVPKTLDLVKNLSLFLVNSHFSINFPRPLLPNVVEVAGIHVPTTAKPLPKDLQEFLDGAPGETGAVLFTFGSLVRADTLPIDKLLAFTEAFRQLRPQRFIWKLDAGAAAARGVALPDNVLAANWLPQFDVLSHPKLRAFISHGGLMGTLEAVHCGVPVLGIPLFADQKLNVPNMVRHGVAVQLDIYHITTDQVVDALRKLTAPGSEYWTRAKQLSALFRDRPRPPLEEAASWVEYVVRHRGAPHMRSAALDLSWYQYLLLDVVAFVVLTAAAALAVLWVLCRKLISLALPPTRAPRKAKAS
ncbi:UDP-glucosyltransferase 2-like [Schistocerca gregaria]|uniref:UDP-glucosyltransferase 2-like n=1 Tax=Schistocerca gregaria TaxID=7010 RepID=UPI00211E6D96|nr:UDP-glucosyltransferase 2-like [Schistocerca gregaria]